MNIQEELLKRTSYMGKYRAIVFDINDPKKMRRIRVVCPEIAGSVSLNWALPCDSHKTDWLPKKDDIVWIEFEGGHNIDFPIWTGLAVAKEDIDSEFLANYKNLKPTENHLYRVDRDYNNNRIERTPEGFTVIDANNIKIKTEVGKVTIDFGTVQIEFSTAGVRAILPSGAYNLVTHIHNTGVGPSSPPLPE